MPIVNQKTDSLKSNDAKLGTEELRHPVERSKKPVFSPIKNSAALNKINNDYGPLRVPKSFELTNTQRAALRSKPINTIGTDQPHSARVWDNLKSDLVAPFKRAGAWIDRAADAVGVPENWRGALKAVVGVAATVAAVAARKFLRKPFTIARTALYRLRYGAKEKVVKRAAGFANKLATKFPRTVGRVHGLASDAFAKVKKFNLKALRKVIRRPVVGRLTKFAIRAPKHPAAFAVAVAGYMAYEVGAFALKYTSLDERIVAATKETKVYKGAVSGLKTAANLASPVTSRVSNLYHKVIGTTPEPTLTEAPSQIASTAEVPLNQDFPGIDPATNQPRYPDLVLPTPTIKPKNNPETFSGNETFSELSFSKPKNIG